MLQRRLERVKTRQVTRLRGRPAVGQREARSRVHDVIVDDVTFSLLQSAASHQTRHRHRRRQHQPTHVYDVYTLQ